MTDWKAVSRKTEKSREDGTQSSVISLEIVRRNGIILPAADDSNPEVRSCVKIEVDVLSSPSLKVPTVSVDVKQH